MIGLLSTSLFSWTINVNSVRFMSHRVFVYGTLKRNEPNHYWLTDKENGVSTFIGDGTTVIKYPLIIATHYNIPFLLQHPGIGHTVQGDIFEVDDKMLAKLDILEDHPNFYIRELDDVVVKKPESNSTESIKCWIYFIKQFNPELLKLPMLENYSSLGDHNRPYMDRCKRDPKYKHELKDITHVKSE